jgi:hypothetical protein
VALTDDQRAMLRLLAQRDEGYEDIAALMGLSVEEVRARVKEALDQLAADEGGAEAPTPVSEPEPEPEEPEPHVPPPAPPAKPEAPPSEPVEEKVVAPKPPKPASLSQSPRIPLPSDSRGWAIVAGGAALVLILIVLIATGAFSGGSSSSSSASSSDTTTSTTASNQSASQNLTQAILAPVDGGNAAGRALFGRVKKSAVLEVLAKGLKPSPPGHSYTVWLYRSPQVSLRIGGVRVGKTGGIAAQFPIPAQLLTYVANGAFDQIDISLTDDAAYKAEVAQAKKQNRLPRYAGTDVLRGRITGPGVKPASGS